MVSLSLDGSILINSKMADMAFHFTGSDQSFQGVFVYGEMFTLVNLFSQELTEVIFLQIL